MQVPVLQQRRLKRGKTFFLVRKPLFSITAKTGIFKLFHLVESHLLALQVSVVNLIIKLLISNQDVFKVY